MRSVLIGRLKSLVGLKADLELDVPQVFGVFPKGEGARDLRADQEVVVEFSMMLAFLEVDYLVFPVSELLKGRS
jgi:hypothetical protein